MATEVKKQAQGALYRTGLSGMAGPGDPVKFLSARPYTSSAFSRFSLSQEHQRGQTGVKGRRAGSLQSKMFLRQHETLLGRIRVCFSTWRKTFCLICLLTFPHNLHSDRWLPTGVPFSNTRLVILEPRSQHTWKPQEGWPVVTNLGTKENCGSVQDPQKGQTVVRSHSVS